MPAPAIQDNPDISPEERGSNSRTKDDVSDFSTDDGGDQSTEKRVDEEEKISRKEIHDPVTSTKHADTGTGEKWSFVGLGFSLGRTQIEIGPGEAGPDNPKSRVREESDELRPSTSSKPDVGANTAYTRSQLAKVSLQFGIGMLILIALGLWGVSAGVMDPAPTFAIAFIGVAASVFSLVLWYSIR